MQRVFEELVPARLLHHLAHVHDDDLVAYVPDDAQVVGYEHVGEAPPLLHVHEQVEYLRLYGHVQGGDGLVADDEFGVHDHGPGEADPLPAPAVELVRVALGVAPGQAALLHDVEHPLLELARGYAAAGQLAQRLGYELEHGHPRVQAAVGVLEDHLHVPVQLLHAPPPVFQYALAAEEHVAAAGLLEPEHAAPERGLAAARLAHDAQGAPAAYAEVHALDRVQQPAARGLEGLAEAPRLDQSFCVFHVSPPPVHTAGRVCCGPRSRRRGAPSPGRPRCAAGSARQSCSPRAA